MDQELKEYLEARFGDMERRFGDMEGRFGDMEGRFGDMEGRFGGMEGRFSGMEGRFSELRQDMDRQFAEVKDEIHQTRILVEKLNDKIDLVAEGVQANTEVMHRHREENRQELREFRSVMEASHRHLEGRVSAHDIELEQLDNRVTFLEARKA